jgi:Ca-activated chloride channel family protein
MTDDKNIPSLDDLIADMDSPPIDTNAKKRAINLAMAEFNQQYSSQSEKQKDKIENNQNKTQGFWSWPRPISNFLTTNRKNIMSILNNKLIYSGVATLSVAVMGTLLFQQTYRPPFDSSVTIVGEELASTGQLLAGPDPIQQIDSKKSEQLNAYDQSLAHAAQASSESRQDSDKVLGLARVENERALATAQGPSQQSSLSDIGESDNAISQAPGFASKPLRESNESAASINQINPSIKKDMASAPLTISSAKAKSIRPESLLQTPDIIAPQGYQEQGRDKFEVVEVNAIKLVAEEPVSTFSIDVDTASYSFARRQLNQGILPQKNAVRIEEMVNYFDYDYPLAESRSQPFKPSIVVQPSPWNTGKKLVHIGIKGYDIPRDQQPRSNLVLLLDVSGSMNSQDKLPLVKQSMSLLLDTLHPEIRLPLRFMPEQQARC